MKTSLEQFLDVVDTQYPQMKKYIVSKSEYHVILEDHNGNCIFGSNKELNPLFEQSAVFPMKKVSASYKERDGYFVINIELK
jgi:hypothetical protein